MTPVSRACAIALAAAAIAAPTAVRAEAPFEVDALADGVHLFRPSGDTSDRVNSLIVERSDGLLVIDAQPSPAAARELLAAIDRRLQGSIRYLVLSHPHAEAAGGADAFPDGIRVIVPVDFGPTVQAEGYGFGAEVAALGGKWAGPPGRELSVFENRLVLDDERHRVEIIQAKHAHTAADVLVHVPDAGLAHAGGILFADGNPYARDANVRGWTSTLNGLIGWGPRTFVGVRGPAMTVTALRAQRDALAWAQGQVQTSLVGRPPLDEFRAEILATPGMGKRFAVDAPTSFLPTLIDRVIDEAIQQRRKRGQW